MLIVESRISEFKRNDSSDIVSDNFASNESNKPLNTPTNVHTLKNYSTKNNSTKS